MQSGGLAGKGGGKNKAVAILIIIAVIFLLALISRSICQVDQGEAAIMIKKTGEDLPAGHIIALKPEQKGIQLDPLPEGWYFKNPYTWTWNIVRQVEIPEGKLGVKIRLFGGPLDKGRVIAKEGQKGILGQVLRPGRYLINTLAYKVEIHKAVQIPPGYVGVVTLMSGKDPQVKNTFLVETGERGVQRKTLIPGTYYLNPYIMDVDPVDIRSHKFDLGGRYIIRFPSADGFEISMQGTVEWYIDPERVPEVYVKYKDHRPIVTCVVEKVIVPYSRSLSRIEGSKYRARDFISGVTRQEFQNKFFAGLKEVCSLQGIVIKSAMVRDTVPPEEIAAPIREREISIRQREKYEQEKDREKQQKQLSMELKLKERKQMINKAQADVSVQITNANQKKEVALIEANRKLDVAQKELQAARDLAKAIFARGKAKADVIIYNNTAEARGLEQSRKAFGEGSAFVRYLFNLKLAPAITYILANTDGPFAEIFQDIVSLKGGSEAPKKP
jgi:regulator of protease activity HflC (stomatin/prohibitin superfamily)